MHQVAAQAGETQLVASAGWLEQTLLNEVRLPPSGVG